MSKSTGNKTPQQTSAAKNTEGTQSNNTPTPEVKLEGVVVGDQTGEQTTLQPALNPEPTPVTPDAPEEGVKVVFEELSETGKALFNYAKAMAANTPVNDKQIANNQAILRNVVTTTLENYQGAEFTKRWAELLNIIAANPSAFSDRLLFRGFPMMKISKRKITALENVLVLMASTANPTERKLALKTIDLNSMVSDFSDVAKQNLQGFYRNA